MKHKLKIVPKYFQEIKSGKKSFEIRKNDRDYNIGDILILKEYEKESYTGKELQCNVVGILYEFEGLKEGFCIMSIRIR